MIILLKKMLPAKAPTNPDATTAHHLGPLRANLTGRVRSKITPVPIGCTGIDAYSSIIKC